MKIHCQYSKLIDAKSLKSHPKNRNKHSKEQIDRLCKILEYQGWRYPIKVSNQSGFITSGHGRLMAALKLGLKEVPVSYQDYESEEAEYADLISDNSIASWSELDFSAINLDIPDLGPDFDIDLLGIKDFTIDVAEKGQCDEDEVPEQIEPKSKLGDLYQLGDHRLLCGDSTDVAQVERLMNGEMATCCITDPPYSVNYEDQEREPGRITRKEKGDTYKDPVDPGNFLLNLFYAIPSDLVCMTYPVDKQFHLLAKATESWDLLYECVWVKNHFAFVIGKRYQQKHEPILIFRRKKGKSTFNVPSNQSTVFEYDKPSKSPDHPTPKPVDLYEKLVAYHSNNGDLIYEPFGGSGTTLIACQKTNRQCFMMEISPHYCDVIVARWEKFTGKKAEILNVSG